MRKDAGSFASPAPVMGAGTAVNKGSGQRSAPTLEEHKGSGSSARLLAPHPHAAATCEHPRQHPAAPGETERGVLLALLPRESRGREKKKSLSSASSPHPLRLFIRELKMLGEAGTALSKLIMPPPAAPLPVPPPRSARPGRDPQEPNGAEHENQR